MSARWRPWIRSIAATPAVTLSSARIASAGIIGGPCPAASTPYTLADRAGTAQKRRIALPKRGRGGMGEVQTTAGPIDSSELGRTLIHEHFRGRDEAAAHQWPHMYDEDDEWRASIEQANAVKEHGGENIREATAVLLRRQEDPLGGLRAENRL